MRVAFTMLVKDLYTILWSLTIAGAFIKPLSYMLVPYIIAENPDIKANDAITLSRRMMNGYKWKCFCYQLSFIGWNILSFISMGLVGYYIPIHIRQHFYRIVCSYKRKCY